MKKICVLIVFAFLSSCASTSPYTGNREPQQTTGVGEVGSSNPKSVSTIPGLFLQNLNMDKGFLCGSISKLFLTSNVTDKHDTNYAYVEIISPNKNASFSFTSRQWDFFRDTIHLAFQSKRKTCIQTDETGILVDRVSVE